MQDDGGVFSEEQHAGRPEEAEREKSPQEHQADTDNQQAITNLLPTALVESQLVEVVHRRARGSPENVHRLPVDHRYVAIPRDRRGPLRVQRHPEPRLHFRLGDRREAHKNQRGKARNKSLRRHIDGRGSSLTKQRIFSLRRGEPGFW